MERLLRVLTAHGIRAFYSRRHIRGAQQWHDEIGAALERCDWFVLVLSPRSVASPWVKHELLYALARARFQGRIVPIVHQKCDFERLSWTLANFQHIDFRRRFEQGCRLLLEPWGVAY